MHKQPDIPPLSVLQVVRPAAGGIRQHVLSLINATDPARAIHSIAAPAAFLHDLPADTPADKLPLEIAARFAPLADLRAARRLAKLARTVNLVHAHGLRAGWIAALTQSVLPFPFVLTAHNMAEGGLPARLAVTLIGQRAQVIIAVSQAVADSLVALGMPPAKLRIVPNGVDGKAFAQLPSEAAARQALGLTEDTFTVGCIARLSPEKGVDVLTQAAAALPDVPVLVAGDGPQRDVLQASLPANVRLLGRIPDTRALLAAVSVLVVPSRLEGQGIVALEAMAARVPLIASHIGGLAEMLTDGETALLVPVGNPAALAEAITRLRADPALQAHLTANAARLVRERYDHRRTVAAVLDVYAELAASRPISPSPT